MINQKNSEESLVQKRLSKAINLIDDFVTKFISKIEYYKMTLESQLNKTQFNLINSPLTKINDNEPSIENKIKTSNNKNDDNNSQKKINNDCEYLNKFVNSKRFYKRALYLLFLISEDKSQIQKILEIDEDNNLKKINENKFSCVKEINTKNFINSISYLKKENLIALGMYNFFDGSSIDLYTLDLKIKLSIKKFGSNIYELESGDLVTCSYNSMNIK